MLAACCPGALLTARCRISPQSFSTLVRAQVLAPPRVQRPQYASLHSSSAVFDDEPSSSAPKKYSSARQRDPSVPSMEKASVGRKAWAARQQAAKATKGVTKARRERTSSRKLGAASCPDNAGRGASNDGNPSPEASPILLKDGRLKWKDWEHLTPEEQEVKKNSDGRYKRLRSMVGVVLKSHTDAGAVRQFKDIHLHLAKALVLIEQPDLKDNLDEVRRLALARLESIAQANEEDAKQNAVTAAEEEGLELPPHLSLGGAVRRDLEQLGSRDVQLVQARLKGVELDSVTDKELMEAFEAQGADGPAVEFMSTNAGGTLRANDIAIQPVTPPRDAKVARLARGLQRVLFSPGIHSLRDRRSGVWNFDAELGNIPKTEDFAYHRLPQYITASRDTELADMAAQAGTDFAGSTSTLTKALSQIYFAISGGKAVNLKALSQEFAEESDNFTAGAQLTAALIIRKLPNGKYAIDNDKSFDSNENILSDYGRVLEKFLTAEKEDFDRFLMSKPESAVPEEERTEREAYAYCKSNGILMRSQLDCQDVRLPGSGTFDIKTRACMPIRHDRANWAANSAYDIAHMSGMTNSFEREFYELSRSGMLKYNFQARIGQMDGIFVAYHNTQRLFGFQYLPLEDIDNIVYGSQEMGQQAFKLCVSALEVILRRATSYFPDQSIKMTMKRIDNKGPGPNKVEIAVLPAEWTGEGPPPARAMDVFFDSELDGVAVQGPVKFSDLPGKRKQQNWSVQYSIAESDESNEQAIGFAQRRYDKHTKQIVDMSALFLPEGKSLKDMDPARHKAEMADLGAIEEEGEESDPMGVGLDYTVDQPDDSTPLVLEDDVLEGVAAWWAQTKPAAPSQSVESPIASSSEPSAESSSSPTSATPSESVDTPAAASSSTADVVPTAADSGNVTPASITASEGSVKTWWSKPTRKAKLMRELAKSTGAEYERQLTRWKAFARQSSWAETEGEAIARVPGLTMEDAAKVVSARKRTRRRKVVKKGEVGEVEAVEEEGYEALQGDSELADESAEESDAANAVAEEVAEKVESAEAEVWNARGLRRASWADRMADSSSNGKSSKWANVGDLTTTRNTEESK